MPKEISNVDIEKYLLGAYADTPDLFIKCQHLVSSAIFTTTSTRFAYKAIKAFHAKNIKPDSTLLFNEAKKAGLPQATCVECMVSETKWEYIAQPEIYVEILFKAYVAKYLMPILENAHSKLLHDEDALEVMSIVKNAITEVELAVNNVSREKSIFDIFDEAVQRIKDLKEGVIEQSGFPFGLDELDKRTGGIQQGVNIIAALSGEGKTSLLINIIKKNTIDMNQPMLFFSLEMPAIEIMTNIISNVAEINSRALRQGDVDEGNMLSINAVKSRLKANFEIDETGGITWQYFEAKVRGFRKKHKISKKNKILVAADFLQLFKNSPDEMKMSLEERISTTCNELARICKSENLAFILISQFSRKDKQREKETPRPKMSDLKGSGAIEACAILILLLFRPEYHGILEDSKGTNLRGLCEINPVKGRYIKPEPVYAKFIGKYSKFEDYKPEDNGIVSGGDEAF